MTFLNPSLTNLVTITSSSTLHVDVLAPCPAVAFFGGVCAQYCVAQGPNLKKKAAIGASTVSMPKDHLKKIFQMLDTDGAFPHWVLFRQT